jgi:hypothetical protein
VIADQVASEMTFDADEVLVLTLLQQVMVGRDLIAEKDAKRSAVKQRYRDELAAAALVTYWSRPEELPEWAREHARAIGARVPAQQRAAIEAAAAELGPRIESRSRALLLMVELVAYQPWGADVRWVSSARRSGLEAVAGYLTALRPGDLRAVTDELDAVLRALARRNVRWGRVAAASAVGVAVGVASMGLATPLIGAAIGGTLGLSGAAATSAGLAALGGGSIAAGGFGMAGGTALLAGIGALGGAGAGAAGSRMRGWRSADVVAAAVKLDVVTRLVILDAEGDDEKARLVVQGLQVRLDEVTAKIGKLGEQLRRLAADKARLTEENQRLRERLEAERAEARTSETALQVVIGRLPARV